MVGLPIKLVEAYAILVLIYGIYRGIHANVVALMKMGNITHRLGIKFTFWARVLW